MRKPGGVAFYCDGINTTTVHSSKCQHCGKFTEFPSLKRMTDYIDFCRVCMRPVCLECAAKGCTPLMKKIEAMEDAAYRRQQMTKVLGI